MWDVRIERLAGRQYNRVSRSQLLEHGVSDEAVDHRVSSGLLVVVEDGVYAIAPVLEHDDLGRWKGATLTSPKTFLSRLSAAVAFGVLDREGALITVTRPGNGGPRRHGGLLVYRSTTLAGETTEFNGIPVTTMPRTLLDLACFVSDKALARALREAIRLKRTTMHRLGDSLGEFGCRRGTRRLAATMARYKGLPIERARSGAEIRAMELLRDAGRPLPGLNFYVAGEEADLSWRSERLIIEIDGGPFHLDAGEDARKERVWRNAGWTVQRIPSDVVYDRLSRLLELAPSPTNVPLTGL